MVVNTLMVGVQTPFGHRVFFSSTICGFDVLDDIRVGKSPHTLRILVKYKGGLFSRFFYATRWDPQKRA